MQEKRNCFQYINIFFSFSFFLCFLSSFPSVFSLLFYVAAISLRLGEVKREGGEGGKTSTEVEREEKKEDGHRCFCLQSALLN